MLSVLMIMASMVTISATFSEANITCDQNVYNITVTVEAENGGTMTAQLSNMANTRLYGMDSNSTPTGTGPYTYTFNFRMPKTAVSGEYRVRVGGNVTTTPTTFHYVDIGDKIDFYEDLEAITDESFLDGTTETSLIKDYFAANSTLVPVIAENMDIYNGLGNRVLRLMNTMIVGLELDPGIDYDDPLDPSDSFDNDSQIAAKVEAKENLFKTNFEAAIAVADIADVSESDWVAKATTALENTTFDDEYYTATAPATPLLQVADAYACYSIEAAAVNNLDLANYQKAFDKATLMLIEQIADDGTLGTAFLYFEGKGSITPVMTHINTLIAADADTALWKELKKKDNTDAATLVANAEDIAERLVANLGGGGGGGGGGGVSKPSTPPIDEPTTPGVSTGIIDKPDDVVVPVFNDLSQAEWAREAVEALAAKGIVAGKGNGAFAPNDNVTREEFVKMIVEAFELLDEGAECNFADVASDRWSAKYIASANRLGVVTGDGANFNPAAQMARQDMAVIIYRVFELAGVDVDGNAIRFTDNGAISGYAKDAVSALSGAGIINGMGDGTFAPKATVTRAQAAKVIYGLLNLIGGDK